MKATYILAAAAVGVAVFLIYKSKRMSNVPEYFTRNNIPRPAPADLQNFEARTLKNLNIIQDELFKLNPAYKIQIHSIYRNPAQNAATGGAKRSRHMRAAAVDFSVAGMPAPELHKFLYKLMLSGKIEKGGIGQGARYAHYDWNLEHGGTDTGGVISTWKYKTDGSNQSYRVSLNTLK